MPVCNIYRIATVNGECFAGLNFCSFLEERESFSHVSFDLSTTYSYVSALAFTTKVLPGKFIYVMSIL